MKLEKNRNLQDNLLKNLLNSFKKFHKIITTLRGPEGCAWDKKQTAESLRGSLLEETYECISAIEHNDDNNLKEELGDLLLLISMISLIKEEEKSFSLKDVMSEITEKLIRRHPHVFGDAEQTTVSGILKQWDEIKSTEKDKNNHKNLLDSVPKNLPPLESAYKIQKCVSKVGFEWDSIEPIWEKLFEEIDELKSALKKYKNNKNNECDKAKMEMEAGDLLFTIVNICRHLNIDPSLALNMCNRKFKNRFNKIELQLKSSGKTLQESNLEQMDKMWTQIKKEE